MFDCAFFHLVLYKLASATLTKYKAARKARNKTEEEKKSIVENLLLYL